MATYLELDSESSDDSKARGGLVCHVVSPSELKPGDHIYVHRLCGIYSHHGIYTGEKRKQSSDTFCRKVEWEF